MVLDNQTAITTKVNAFIDRAFTILLYFLCFTMPFAKVIAGPVYVTCVVLFVIQTSIRKGYQNEAKLYYLAALLYLSVIALSLGYTSDFVQGLGVFKQQCIVLIGVILIERVASGEMARRYLYAFAAGGTILALTGLWQGLYMHLVRPPSIWYPVHGGNLLLFSSVVLIALLISERSFALKIVGAVMLAAHGAALYLNGTRGAWIALAIVVLLVPFFVRNFNYKKKILCLVFLSFIGIVAWKGNFFQQKLSEAENDIKAYNSSYSETSLGFRFEMWKASSHMFRNNPILGIGMGGWQKELREMVRQREAPAFLMQFNQTHSIYLDALSTRGLIGLFSLLLLTACPLYYALKSREPENQLFRNVVILIAVAFMVSGATDTLPYIRFVFMSYMTITGLGLAALISSRSNCG